MAGIGGLFEAAWGLSHLVDDVRLERADTLFVSLVKGPLLDPL